ncbi:MAG: cytosine deaminase, partial [Geminicoccaceae bacterium]|nr:cytosine deaminase [Geminicoccaceae bacterium]
MTNEVELIRDASAPACLLPQGEWTVEDGMVRVDVELKDGRIAALHPAGRATVHPKLAALAADGGMVWPGPVDLHTHLDKGHIWPRAANPDGTFESALEAVRCDREAHWSERDVAARMEFALRCAYAHGTVAIRTHLDSSPPQHGISWPVFTEMRRRWRGRIELQAVSLLTPDELASPFGEELADLVAGHGGVLGGATFMMPGLEKILDRVFALAAERRLDLDFHVDESLDPGARSLGLIAEAKLRTGFDGRVVCGHCCSLAVQEEGEAGEIIARVRDAALAVVSLPMCNLYLQD